MVLTAAQQASFFTNQMLVPAATRTQMVTEGVSTVEDLLEYNENKHHRIISHNYGSILIKVPITRNSQIHAKLRVL